MKKNEEKNKNGNPVFGAIGTASSMGLHMVSGPIVGSALGYACDAYLFDSWPYGSIIGFILGVLAGFKNVHADAQLLLKKQKEMDDYDK